MICFDIALRMLKEDDPKPSIDKIHPDIRRKLVLIDTLAQQAGGSIVSRQVVALVIADWIIQYPHEKPYLKEKTE